MAWPRAPTCSYAAALAAAAVSFGLFAVLLYRVDFEVSTRISLAAILCWCLGAGFALAWPGGSWRWGLWVSSGFWAFLALVFLAFLLNDGLEWSPALEAIALAGAACIGAAFGTWLARRIRRAPGPAPRP